jgi:hypothetical protein
MPQPQSMIFEAFGFLSKYRPAAHANPRGACAARFIDGFG